MNETSKRAPVERIVGRLRQYVILRTEADNDSKLHDLMLDAADEIERLQALCVCVHDRLLRGDSDAELLAMLESGWCEPSYREPPNAALSSGRRSKTNTGRVSNRRSARMASSVATLGGECELAAD
jgi:hypothetical protein